MQIILRAAAVLLAIVSAFTGAAAQDAAIEPLLNSIPVDPAVDSTMPVLASSETSPPEAVGLDEIIVTAQKRSESANDVPISISAFSGEDLKALGVEDTRSLGKLVPGFTVGDSGYNTPVYTLRGVGFNDSTYTATATVGVYEDEASLPYAIMTKGPALDLQRIEVLKGPQGILYGRNTTGGALNYIANQPTDSFKSGLSGSVARFDTTDIEGYVSGPIAEGLEGRLAVKDIRSQTGWQYSNTRPDDRLGEENKQALRGSLAWAATQTLDVRATLSGWRDHGEPQAPQVLEVRQQNAIDPTRMALLPPQARSYPVISRNDASPRVADWSPTEDWRLRDQFLSATLRADWAVTEDTALTAIASQMRVDSNNTTFPSSGYNYNAFEQALDAHIETSALETRLAGTFGEEKNVEWMVGGNVSRDRGYEDHIEYTDFQSALAPDPATGRSTLTNRPEFKGAVQIDQIAGFVNVGWRFTDTLRLTTGGRYTKQNQDATACSFVSPSADYDNLSAVFTGISTITAAQYTLDTGMPGQPSQVQSGDCFSLAANGSNEEYRDALNESNFAWRTAIDWQPEEKDLYYASIGKGFKAGGYPVLGASSHTQFAPVTQEKLLAFEIGAKNGLLDRQMQLNTALYYYDYRDKQLLSFTRDPFFGPLPILLNAPKSRVYGAEAELKFAPDAVRGLLVSLAGAYTNTRVTKFVGLNSQGEQYDFSGRPFNFAPKYQGTALVNYLRPVTASLSAVLGADYTYNTSTSSSLDPDPAFEHDAYGLFGARLGVSGESWELVAFGRNLTNELYATTILAFGDSVHRYTGEPRTFGLSFTYRWEPQ